MQIRTDICKVPGFPFTANLAAQQEYGYSKGHPLIRPYFQSPPPVRFYYWRKLKLVSSLFKYNPRSVVLDVGCGPGIFIPTLANFFDRVIAIDINDDDLRIARRVCESLKIKNVSLFNINLVNAPIQNESIDIVFAIDVFEHIESLSLMVDNLCAMMNNDAMLIVSAPTENLFNDIARMSAGFVKPETHYHSSSEIKSVLDSRFRMLKRKRTFNLPWSLSPAEVFLYAKR